MGTATSFEQIRCERRDDVVLITLHRPERMNAWTPRMTQEMTAVITDANDDRDVGAIVVTGEGRAFCAGADIGGQFAAKLDDRGDAPAESSGGTSGGEAPAAASWVELCRTSKPLIAALNGAAIGVGLTMVLPFDRLLAVPTAKLSARFVRMGLVPELASSHFLVARCGWGAASWLALSGATIDGVEAERIRLVDRVVDGDVVAAAVDDAHLLAENPAPQLRMIKELLTANASAVDLAAVQQRELAALEVAYRTPEHREAVTAFMEKRPPDFRSAADARS